MPAAWFGIFRAEGIQFQTKQDPLGLITSLEGVMGALLVVGGLIIALSAVITVIAVDERVKRAFDDRTIELEKRAAEQIQAYQTLFRAKSTRGWDRKVALATQAKKQHSGLSGPVALYIASCLGNREICSFALTHTRIGNPYSVQRVDGAGVDVALSKIADAKDYVADVEDTAELERLEALLLGVKGDFDPMLAALRRACKAGTDSIGRLRLAPFLAMLVVACGSDVNKLRRLGGQLALSLPIPIGTVHESLTISALMREAAGEMVAEWLVLPRMGPPWVHSDRARFPLSLRLGLASAPGEPPRFSVVLRPECRLDTRLDVLDPSRNPWPPDDLLSLLDKDFLFVCPDTTVRLPDDEDDGEQRVDG